MSAITEPQITTAICVRWLDELQVNPVALAKPLDFVAPTHKRNFVVNAPGDEVKSQIREMLPMRLITELGKLTVVRIPPESIQIEHVIRADWSYQPVLRKPVDDLAITRIAEGWGFDGDASFVLDPSGFQTFWAQIADKMLRHLALIKS